MYEMKGALSGYGPGSAGFPASRLRVSQSPSLTVPVKLVFPASPNQIDRSPGLTVPVRPVIQTPRPVHPVARARHPVRPAARTPQRHAPPAGARHPLQIPVSRPFHRPWGDPGMVPVSCGESISTPFARVAQEPTGIHFRFLSCPHLVHRIPSVIRTSRRLSTALCTATPQVTRRNSENTSARSPNVITPSFPDDPPLIPNSRPAPARSRDLPTPRSRTSSRHPWCPPCRSVWCGRCHCHWCAARAPRPLPAARTSQAT